MMTLTTLFTTALLISSAAANLFSSGMFLVRISSEEPYHIQYCFTELPYSVRRRHNNRCLKSGSVEVAKRTEKVIDLSLINVTTAYVTVEFIIQIGGQGPTRYISERVIVDGALPAKRIAVASGLVMDFVTICDRPWYGLMCSRYCTEHNDAHYVCDPRGEKVCLAGWTGKDCDTVTEDVFLATIDDSTQTTPTTIPSTIETTFTFTGTKAMETVTTTAAAPVTSFVATSTKKKLRVQKGSMAVSLFTTKNSAVQNTRTTLLTSSSTSSPTLSTTQAPKSTTSPKHKQDSENNTNRIVIALFLLLTAIIVIGYSLTLCARNTSMQNWINSRKAKIFARITCAAAVQRYEAKEPVPKVFTIDVEKTTTKVAYETSEELGPRYSSQPTTSADQSPSKSVVSTAESNVYHEIDSFLVSPLLVEQRIATLV